MMKTKSLLQDISVWLYLFSGAIVVGATVYQMFVIIPEFSRDAPDGMIAFAQSHVDPRNFWRSSMGIYSNLVTIIALIINWKTGRRKWLLLSIAFGIGAGIFTVVYFVPRLQIMGLIDDKTSGDSVLLITTIKEWIIADKWRFWILAVPAFFFGLKAATVPLIKQEQKNVYAAARFETAIA
ncbi:MAG: hypothetical protein ABIN97_10955 [Ginsengibacter sp.]